MPIYEYICDNCGYRFEIFRQIGKDYGINCTKCNTGVRRIYSSVPFIFGGTRWVGEYTKDNKNRVEDKSGNQTKATQEES
jgi:putative FmdB family regulatory protein